MSLSSCILLFSSSCIILESRPLKEAASTFPLSFHLPIIILTLFLGRCVPSVRTDTSDAVANFTFAKHPSNDLILPED